ncbi:response regulator [bacterium]|nr:response regulator [bacterium]
MTTVLVLDDDPDLRALICSALRAHLVEALEAGSVEEARRVLSRQSVDAVVVDGLLPDGRGLDFIAEVRSRDNTTEFVFISGHCQDLKTFRQLTREFHVSLVLCKPFDPLELASELRHLLIDSSTPPLEASLEEELEEQFEALSRNYRERLPQKLEELRESLELARRDPENIPLARSLAHRLHGSAGSYGLPELGEVVGKIEAQLSETGPSDGSWSWDRPFEFLREAQSLLHRLLPLSPKRRTPVEEISYLLVVDDDTDFLELLQALSSKRGIPVVTARSPEQALDLAARLPLIGAILDVHMGSELTFGLARGLRDVKGKSELPLAFASVDHSLETLVAASAAGGTRFFDKPISEESLMSLVQQFVQQSQERQSRVLLVDDDPDIVRQYSGILRAAQLSVDTLPDPENLLERMETYRPDLLMLDIELPTWSGLDICRALRSSPQWDLLPILMISSQLDVSRRVRAYQAGASDVLTKPLVEEELVARVTVQLDRARLLKDRSDRDPLSGLLLRRAFLDASQRALAGCSRAGTPLSVALIDIDYFKSINDRYGHSVGDQVIAALGNLLLRRFRAEDLRCRWGGEEFLLAFPGQTAEFATMAARRLLQEFASVPFVTETDETFQVTFTAGVSAYPQDGSSLLALVRKADEALYAGKNAGRNQVQAAHPSTVAFRR